MLSSFGLEEPSSRPGHAWALVPLLSVIVEEVLLFACGFGRLSEADMGLSPSVFPHSMKSSSVPLEIHVKSIWHARALAPLLVSADTIIQLLAEEKLIGARH